MCDVVSGGAIGNVLLNGATVVVSEGLTVTITLINSGGAKVVSDDWHVLLRCGLDGGG